MTDSEPRARRLFTRLLSELAIIFLGVSAAFVVEDVRQSREDERQIAQLTRALLEHLAVEDSINGEMIASITAGLGEWRARHARGEQPVPYTFEVVGSLRPPVGVWEAVRESEAAELLEPRLLFQIANYYNEIYGTADRFVQHNSFAEFEILPRLREGATAFYQPSGDLAPEYLGYMDRLRDMTRYIERHRQSNQDLQVVLRETLPDSNGAI